MKRSASAGLGVLLLVLWLLLWGEVTPANLLSGLLVIGLVLLIIPEVGIGLDYPVVRPIWAIRFLLRVAWSLLRANVTVAREVASPGSSIRTGIIAVPMEHCSDGLVTLVANVLGLAPGTMPLEVARNPKVIYVHVLQLDDVEGMREEILSMAHLAVRAFGSREALEAIG